MEKLNLEIDPHVAQRLRDETVIWLTTVSADGTPQPNPVWFYWDDCGFLIYTQPQAAKLKNITRRPNVSLHLEGADTYGGDVIVFTGQAYIEDHLPAPDPGYVQKYAQAAAHWGQTVEDLYQEFSVPIRVIPTRVRVF